MRNFHKPVHRPSEVIETLAGGGDPAEISALAHDSAAALLHRVRATSDPQIVTRLLSYAAAHGIDDVAELWAKAPAVSLPGALWRLYLLRHEVAADPTLAGEQFRRGLQHSSGVQQAIAGSPQAPSPVEVLTLINTIFSGAFTGDFELALHRAAAFAHVMASGAEHAASEHTFLRLAEQLIANAARLDHS